MKYTFLFFLSFACNQLYAQSNKEYNIIWNSQSKNASESMPCGGGDMGMNVWVENGDLLIYVQRSGSFDENNALMKSGRIRIKLFPNVFNGKAFKQELHLQEGYVTVAGENNGVKATVKIWADVFNPVAHFDITANKKIKVEAAYESWRYRDRVITSKENWGNSYKWAAPKNNVYKKDSIGYEKSGVVFYHYNSSQTIFDATVAQQGLDTVKNELYNPLKQLAFGGFFYGDDFYYSGTDTGTYVQTDFKAWNIKSKTASKSHSLNLLLYTKQVEKINLWKWSLDSMVTSIVANEIAFEKTQAWWKQFWTRSFIAIDNKNSNSRAWQVGRNFQLFRYMLACNAKGQWPTKSNGGLFTVDPSFTDTVNKNLTPDYRIGVVDYTPHKIKGSFIFP